MIKNCFLIFEGYTTYFIINYAFMYHSLILCIIWESYINWTTAFHQFKLITTTLSSFTDGLIPSVKAIKSVGEKHTDGFTDGSDPSVKQSSVNPISVANSVQNNNLQNKMNERTYHEVLSTVVHELLHPFLAVLTPHMRL